MSDKKISYLSRNFDDYRQSLLELVKKYYPQISDSFSDSSIGSWLIDIVAAVADNLSFHIDRTFNETSIDGASEASSVYSLARSNGFKIPGPRPSIAEETFTCVVPLYSNEPNDSSLYGMPNVSLMPVIKRGTRLSSGGHYFEVMDDIDFSEQFNSNGYSDRTMSALYDSNGNINAYKLTKNALVIGGYSKVYRQVINASDITPFMEVILPDKDIISIESIIFKDGDTYEVDPTMSEFMLPREFSEEVKNGKKEVTLWRFFEVNSLAEQYRWGDWTNKDLNNGEPVNYTYGFTSTVENVIVPTATVVKGEWVPLSQKFITEYTDNGYLKITFGSGESVGSREDMSNFSDFNKYQVAKMIRNNYLGKLPPNRTTTMYVLYRVGGGASSNVAANTITNFINLNVDFPSCPSVTDMSLVRKTITCTNKQPSVAGKDAPSINEIKHLIKYHNAAQERCVVLKDYEERVLLMPSRYGVPFRISAIEENNKVMLYMLGIDNNGKLSDKIPVLMIQNIENYLAKYRAINDFVEIKNGRIINISIEMDLFVDKNYSLESVLLDVTNKINGYMDISKHRLGEDIYIGDIEREVGNIEGVLNVIETRVFNEFGSEYSNTITTQAILSENTTHTNSYEIDLEQSQYTLNSESDEMFEIKYPEKDIRIKVMQR